MFRNHFVVAALCLSALGIAPFGIFGENVTQNVTISSNADEKFVGFDHLQNPKPHQLTLNLNAATGKTIKSSRIVGNGDILWTPDGNTNNPGQKHTYKIIGDDGNFDDAGPALTVRGKIDGSSGGTGASGTDPEFLVGVADVNITAHPGDPDKEYSSSLGSDNDYPDGSYGIFVLPNDEVTVNVDVRSSLKGTLKVHAFNGVKIKTTPNGVFETGWSWSNITTTSKTIYVKFEGPADPAKLTYIRAKFYKSESGPFAIDKLKINPVEWYPQVTKLTYNIDTGAGSIHTIKKDSGGDYGTPHWQGAQSPENNSPVAFTKESKMKVNTEFELHIEDGMPDPAAGDIWVRGTGPVDRGLDFAEKKASGYDADDNIVTMTNYVCEGAFDDAVDIHNPLQISWEISIDDRVTWQPAGATENQVYILRAAPTSTLYHTVAHVGCSAAKGKLAEWDVVEAIKARFATLVVRNWKEEPAAGFGYYRALANCPAENKTQVLITAFDGRCGAWATFLRDVNKSHGISASAILIFPDANAPDAPANAIGAHAVGVKNWNSNVSPPKPVGSVDVQGGTTNTTPQLFSFHGLTRVTIGGVSKLYDPAYGKGPFEDGDGMTALQKWQNNSSLYLVSFLLLNGDKKVLEVGPGDPLVVKVDLTLP